MFYIPKFSHFFGRTSSDFGLFYNRRGRGIDSENSGEEAAFQAPNSPLLSAYHQARGQVLLVYQEARSPVHHRQAHLGSCGSHHGSHWSAWSRPVHSQSGLLLHFDHLQRLRLHLRLLPRPLLLGHQGGAQTLQPHLKVPLHQIRALLCFLAVHSHRNLHLLQSHKARQAHFCTFPISFFFLTLYFSGFVEQDSSFSGTSRLSRLHANVRL